MSFEKQVTITPDFDSADKVDLMFDVEELKLLMADFQQGFRTTTKVTRKRSGTARRGGGFDYKDVLDPVRDYDYYRNNELWGEIAEKLDIDMASDDFNDEKLSEMYAFAYDQNEEYENPTFNDSSVEFEPYLVDDDDNSETPGVVPLMDISYTNKYTDAEKTKKHAFAGAQYKIGDSMSLNFEELQANYSPLPSSSGNPEDSNFNGNTNSLYT